MNHIETHTDRKNLLIYNRDIGKGYYDYTIITNCTNVIIENIEFQDECLIHNIIIDRSSHVYFKNINTKNTGLINIYIRSGTHTIILDNCNINKLYLGTYSPYELESIYEFVDVGESLPKRLCLCHELPRTPVFNINLINCNINLLTCMNCVFKSINKFNTNIHLNLRFNKFFTKIWFMLKKIFSDSIFIAKSHATIKPDEINKYYNHNMQLMRTNVIALNRIET